MKKIGSFSSAMVCIFLLALLIIVPTYSNAAGFTSDGDFDNTMTCDIYDALKALRITVMLEIPTEHDMQHGDVFPLVDGVPVPDGLININDSLNILRRIVGLIKWKNAAPIVPAPKSVTAVGGERKIYLSWAAPSDSQSSVKTTPPTEMYNIYYSKTQGVTPLTGEKISTDTNKFTLTGLEDETTYYFVITAIVQTGGESGPSVEVSAITAPAPGPITDPILNVDPTKGSVLETILAGYNKFVVANGNEIYLSMFDINNTSVNIEKISQTGVFSSFAGAAVTGNKFFTATNNLDMQTFTQTSYLYAFDSSTGKKIPEATREYAALCGITTDQAAGILYVVSVKDFSGITWIDAINVATGEVIASRGDSPGDPKYGAFDGGKYFVQDGILHVLGRVMPSQGGGKVKVFRFKDNLETELPSFSYFDPAVVNDIDRTTGFALSPDSKTLVVSETLNVFSGNAKEALVKFDVATGTATVTEISAIAIDPTFDGSGILYCVIGNNLVKINVANMTQTVLKSGVSHLTLDKETETIYAASGSDVFLLNLDGSSK